MENGGLSEVFLKACSKELRKRRKFNRDEIERERKYVCSTKLLGDFIPSRASVEQHIVQSYFPRAFGEFLIPLAVELQLVTPGFRALQVTQARLRLVEEGRSNSYSLAVKGRLPGLLPTERIELPLSLSKETYKALLPHARGGTVTKKRFVYPVQGVRRLAKKGRCLERPQELQLEVDIPGKRYAGDSKVEDLQVLNLAFLEIELATREVDRALRKGIHDINILHQALDISKDQTKHEKFRKLLSWSRLARKGLSDPKLKKAVGKIQAKLS